MIDMCGAHVTAIDRREGRFTQHLCTDARIGARSKE